MELWFLASLLAVGTLVLKSREQQRRIALLGQHLGEYRVEKLMETLTQGYLRALGEADPERAGPIWQLLASAEQDLATQFSRFAAGFARVDAAQTRVSKIPWALPLADRWLPQATFDVRAAFQLHADGIARVVGNAAGLGPKDKAFTLSAELFLMQHTCHWFCRSKATASARVLVRHQTPHAQLVASVSPETRAGYTALTGG
ncbi:MAG: hypothetical protein V4738_02015 [Pseudomonadota bacterium]